MRSISLTWNFGLVEVHIPVTQTNSDTEKNNHVINDNTLALGIGKHAYFFGKLKDFAKNSQSYPHAVIQPITDNEVDDLKNLIITLKKTITSHPQERIGVMVMDSNTPLLRLLSAIQEVKTHKIFNHIVLSGGFFSKPNTPEAQTPEDEEG